MLWTLWRHTVVKMSDLAAITYNLNRVRELVRAAADCRSQELQQAFPIPRLVAVSKTKPKECIIQAYKDGQQHFGENYVQELVDKASDPQLQQECSDVKFHFIGHLQKNKISKLLSVVEKLFVVETIDSEGLAQNLNDACERRGITERLNIMVQVNTSGESTKSGVPPESCGKLVQYIGERCPKLNFLGLMTIGAYEHDHEPNKDFIMLSDIRTKICNELNMKISAVELSMGMSADYEEAIQLGSSNVRVGSIIFGPRLPPPTSS
ncbi:pyridoxal phosphate homeostasis protein [Folsomia candida]|uniref:Pyridoxal phosphate homeostasis protein n=1 Tax=Folsomia candida TaxID=158441 RepID=A0A226DEJ8_FOLCA|nr:pyridoxal phosphate homeostasis protein [Folsomia candida]OXA43982.1 Proline synthase co-transcribed bacterial protein [Folsomia candida]